MAVALGLNELINASGTYCMLEGSFAAKTALYKCVCTEKKKKKLKITWSLVAVKVIQDGCSVYIV